MISVFNMIPQSMSFETTRDSEPNIAVNPANPLEMAASPFTFDPMPGATAPIFVTTDRGRNWTLNSIIPSQNKTQDTTIRFGTFNRVLYCGAIVNPTTETQILRTTDFLGAALMTLMVNRGGAGGKLDQPWVEAATVAAGADFGRDRVYVGYNNLNASPQTATVEVSLDGASAPPAGLTTFVMENRTTSGQDSPPVRIAIHGTGVVYLAFLRRTAGSGASAFGDVIVRRDDAWGAGATPFLALTDISDGLAGRKVATGLNFPFLSGAALAQERIGGMLAIAVDPTDAQKVYLAFSAGTSNTDFTTVLRRSDDGGQTWTGDLLTVANLKNPALAVNAVGRVAFLYQELTTATPARWDTRLLQSADGFATVASNDVLATTVSTGGAYVNNNNLGDFCGVQAVGRRFYGVFSAENTPDMANFPQLVTYRRNADFATHQLKSTDNVTIVNPSIDPFFFDAQPLEDANDVYVRDWTDSPASADPGDEPSTHPQFYVTPDVWNQRTSSVPNIDANDRPVNEAPRNGAGPAGDNFAFARIRRKATGGPATTATAHFLYSEFGTGSNYVDAGSETVAFAAGAAGPQFTPAHTWNLPATSSNHLCFAVEISTPEDPFIPPSLLGAAPGWTSGTDMRVTADNNKAQRNMAVYNGAADGGEDVTYYALVHNASTGVRDLELRYQTSPGALKRFPGATVAIPGQTRPAAVGESGSLSFEGMLPGENRWLALTLPSPKGRPGVIDPFVFHEMAGEIPVNGFAIAVRAASLSTCVAETMHKHASVFARLANSPLAGLAEAETASATKLGRNAPAAAYARLVRRSERAFARAVAEHRKGGDVTGAGARLKRLREALSGRDPLRVVTAHAAVLHALDALVTTRHKEHGDPADILQNLRWQHRLLTQDPRWAALPGAALVARSSRDFVVEAGHRRRKLTELPGLMGDSLELLRALPKHDRRNASVLRDRVAALESSLGSLADLQRAHRELLLALDSPGNL